MSECKRWHDHAMALADDAFLAQRYYDPAIAQSLFQRAYRHEIEAAKLAGDVQPSRAVLYRSAATLALHAGILKEARAAAEAGLAGNPPPEIRIELEDVLAQVIANSDVAKGRGR